MSKGAESPEVLLPENPTITLVCPMKGVLSAELAGVVLTLKSMGALPFKLPLPPPQADKIRHNSKKPLRIHYPELNEKIDRERRRIRKGYTKNTGVIFFV